MKQHVIPEWLLRAFALRGPGGTALVAFDKATGQTTPEKPADFLAELDAHAPAIERAIADIETPAADAAHRLAKLMKPLPPGLYAVNKAGGPVTVSDSTIVDGGTLLGMRLLVGQSEVPIPERDRAVLARFIALAYQRAPKVEAAKIALRRAYDLAADEALVAMRTPFRHQVGDGFAEVRSSLTRLAANITPVLERASWWVVRADQRRPFILGDSMVSTTIALGHDTDEWRAILAPEAHVVVAALGPLIALLLAPAHLMPTAGIESDLDEIVDAINRLSWRNAGRYVMARRRPDLLGIWQEGDPRQREGVEVAISEERAAAHAHGLVVHAVVEFQRRELVRRWHRWDGCEEWWGYYPWDAADRSLFREPCPGWASPATLRDVLVTRRRP